MLKSQSSLLGFCLIALLTPATGGGQTDEFVRVSTFAYRWDDYPPDARSAAMGGAFVAVAEGPAGLWWNPAASSRTHRLEFNYVWLDQSRPYLSYNTLAAAVGWRNIRLGFYQGRFGSSPPQVHPSFWPTSNGESVQVRQFLRLYGASVDLAPWLGLQTESWQWSVGANLRTYLTTFKPADLASQGSVEDLDLGTIVRWRDQLGGRGWYGLRLGGSLRNAFKNVPSFDGAVAPVRQELRLGIALEGGLASHPRWGHRFAWLLSYMRSEYLVTGWVSDRDSDRVGLELLFGSLIALRGGYNSVPWREASFWSYGFGLIFEKPQGGLPIGLTFDYTRAAAGPPRGGWSSQLALGVRIRS
jgi:hypothetical protein